MQVKIGILFFQWNPIQFKFDITSDKSTKIPFFYANFLSLLPITHIENIYFTRKYQSKWIYGDVSKCLRWKCGTIGCRFDHINIANAKSRHHLACKLKECAKS